jgi:hypothetical protein
MKLLVLTSEPISAGQLRDAVSGNVDPADAEVMLVAPALQENPLKFWFSDADNAIARAEEVRAQSLERLGEEGVAASGDTGESDPIQAIQDALLTFPADRIVLFTHQGEAAQYREDVDPQQVGQRFGLPVDHATV